MIPRKCSASIGQFVLHDSRSSIRLPCALPQRRHASEQVAAAEAAVAANPLEDLDPSSSFASNGAVHDQVQSFDPLGLSGKRKKQLSPSRYKFRSPKYYRGPLHPHQPPPASDPSSREFVPGPFTLPRLAQTYQSTIAPDFMTLTYAHRPPGLESAPRPQRLRTWDDSSPYHKNRPLRPPRGGHALRLLNERITFRNIPKLERVTLHSMVSEAKKDSAYLHVAGMVLQVITGVRVTAVKSRTDVAGFDLRKNKYIAVKNELRGEDMYHFVSRLVDIVLPRIKDWSGVAGSAGDSSGNIMFGLTPDAVRLFPEVEVNYDMYPPDMIPGLHVRLHTSARQDREARLLLRALGIPFHGKMID